MSYLRRLHQGKIAGMPYILCTIHGGGPACHVCEHIAQQVRAKSKIRTPIRVQAEYFGKPAWAVNLCEVCAADLGYVADTILHDEDGLEQLLSIADQVPVCASCLGDHLG